MFQLDMEGEVARLRMSRPEARNAIPVASWAKLAELGEKAAASGARLLILSGAPGGAFSAGADLGEFHRFRDDPEARSGFRLAMHSGLERIRELPIATVAVVEGPCYGAGTALAMACDIRFAGKGAAFAITPAKLGISFPQEDVHRLVSLVGPGQAARLLLGAQSIDGREAERIGLVECFVEGDLAAQVDAFAAAVAANAPESIAVLKRGIALAAADIRSDDDQDNSFDALLGADGLFERLAARSRR